MFSTRLLALSALLLSSFVGVGVSDDEIVKEFKKYFRKYKDTPTRVEAILALDGSEGNAVVDVLVPVLRDPEPKVVEACLKILGGFEAEASKARLFEKLEKEKKEPLRLGILRAIAQGGYQGGDEVLQECLEDRSWEVRWRTLQVLGAGGRTEAEEIILPFCADEEVAVRCAALEALADLRSPLVHEAAHTALVDPAWQVRSSAIAALGQVRRTESVAWLIERMPLEEGRLREDLGKALEALTGRTFGTRLELWQRLVEAGDYEIPTDEKLAELRKRRAKVEESYTGGVAYHGIETPSRSILFIIDISGSMENEVIERERFEDGDFPSFQRIDIVKTELARTIEGLEDYVNFNMLAFATKVDPWKKGLVKANVLNKSSAVSWAERLQPLGGESKMALGSVGLTGAADLSAGKTNTYGALAEALGLTEKGSRAEDYEIEVDTIFFLSDGRPTTGDFIDPQDILREIGEANALRKVVIHTIALGEFQKGFMKRLAEENGGVFVDLGR